jgi:adenine-specific DNA-methyltransferase
MTLTKIDDKALKDVISELYFPKSPYKFDAIPAEILGQVYEQFLGKVIRLTEGGHAKVEEKPEVRKAGGIYYTPTYIVEYIVRNTVGKLVEGKTPKKIEKLTIVDPACGSGSFLLGAYKYLADWYRDWYVADDEAKHEKTGRIYRDQDKQWQLTLEERKRILTAHIYGVDLDRQAVELAKLSLMLEALRAPEQQSLFNDQMLPRLGNNIKCGNSLIGTDYFAGQTGVDSGEMARINAFDWEAEFSEIFKRGGFDIVIGNPPYLKELNSKETFRDIRKGSYKRYYQGKMDLWYFFLHKALDIIRDGGCIGYITNSYFLKNTGAVKLIGRLRNEAVLEQYIDFGGLPIFHRVSGKHAIHIYERKTPKENDLVNVCGVNSISGNNFEISSCYHIEYLKIFTKDAKISFSKELIDFNCFRFLAEDYDVSIGVQESPDKVSKKKASNLYPAGTGVFVISKEELERLNLNEVERRAIKKYLDSGDVDRYSIHFNNQYLIYSDNIVREKIRSSAYPKLKRHFDGLKQFITSSNGPYGLHRPREQRFFEGPKLICKGMFSRPSFTLDDELFYVGFSFSLIIAKHSGVSIVYLLGLLNSKFADYWFHLRGKKRGGDLDIGVGVYRQFPLPVRTLSQDVKSIEALVNQMLTLNHKLTLVIEENERLALQRQIVATDRQIDQLVYKLYGLTDEEIRIVEGE